MAGLTFKNIGKVYDNGYRAVKDFNLEVEEGEFIAFVGPSGCGKSTTLRMIAGLEEISEGELSIDGKVVNNLAPSERDIAMVFQSYALYGNLTTYENIGFSLTVRHQDSDTIHERVMEGARQVDLLDYLNRKPENLSGGQRQRVALGRSIVRDANIFLLDEPLSNLDAKLRTETRKELVQLHAELGITFVYVTHDQVEAMTMADRIVVMDKGVIQQVGTPMEVYHEPVNLFVASFIGTPPMNFVEGYIENDQFVSDVMTFNLNEEQKAKFTHQGKREVTLGVRPEDIQAAELVEIEDPNYAPFDAKLDIVELLGSDMLVYFDINGKTLNARITADSNFVRDQEVKLALELPLVHFFDAKTTDRIIVGGE